MFFPAAPGCFLSSSHEASLRDIHLFYLWPQVRQWRTVSTTATAFSRLNQPISLSWMQHACSLTTFMSFSQTCSYLTKSLLYWRPQTGHVILGTASKVPNRGVLPGPFNLLAIVVLNTAQYSAKFCCHKGALQTWAQCVHHKIRVPSPTRSFPVKLLSGEGPGFQDCTRQLLLTCRTWLLSEPHEVPVKPHPRLAAVPPDNSCTLQHTTWKSSTPGFVLKPAHLPSALLPTVQVGQYVTSCWPKEQHSAGCQGPQTVAQHLELGGPATPTTTSALSMLPPFACRDSTCDVIKSLTEVNIKAFTAPPFCTDQKAYSLLRHHFAFCKLMLASPNHLPVFTCLDPLSWHFWRQA